MSSIPTPPLDPHTRVHSPIHWSRRGKMNVRFVDEPEEISPISPISPIKIRTPLLIDKNPDIRRPAIPRTAAEANWPTEEAKGDYYVDVQDHEAITTLLGLSERGDNDYNLRGVLRTVHEVFSLRNVREWKRDMIKSFLSDKTPELSLSGRVDSAWRKSGSGADPATLRQST